jgi:ABC-type multidrug transport system ATPase subunit
VCKGLSKAYQNVLVFKDVNLHFEQRSHLLRGRNGSGKSTLLRILAGLEPPYQGEVNWQFPSAPRIAFASESVLPPDVYTAKEVFTLIESYNEVNLTKKAELIDALEFAVFLDTKVAELSSGSLKKLLLISALMKKSEVLLLDEPFASLDKMSQEKIQQFILGDERFRIVVDHHQLMPNEGIVEMPNSAKPEVGN